MAAKNSNGTASAPTLGTRPVTGMSVTAPGTAGGWGGAAGAHPDEGSVLGSWEGSRTGHGIPVGGGASGLAATGYVTNHTAQVRVCVCCVFRVCRACAVFRRGVPTHDSCSPFVPPTCTSTLARVACCPHNLVARAGLLQVRPGTLSHAERVHTSWGVGTAVEVSFGGATSRAKAHRGTIAHINPDGSYDVRWVDTGEVHKFVSRQFIRAVDPVGASGLPSRPGSAETEQSRLTTATTRLGTAASVGTNVSVATAIEVSYDGGRSWLPGHVAKVHSNGTVDVLHDDAGTDLEQEVPLEWLRPATSSKRRSSSHRHGGSNSTSRRRSHTKGTSASASANHASGAGEGSSGAAAATKGSATPINLGDPVEVSDKVHWAHARAHPTTHRHSTHTRHCQMLLLLFLFLRFSRVSRLCGAFSAKARFIWGVL